MSLHFEVFNQDHVSLAWSFSINPDSGCSEDYYRTQLVSAFSDMKLGNSVTHVMVDEKDGVKTIAGFVTLRACAYLTQYPGDENFFASPAIEIECLAVDKNYERQGIGTLLVLKAITIAAELCDKYVGVQYIVLRSSKNAVSFYTRKDIGFERISKIGKLPSNTYNEDCIPLIVKIELHNN